VTTGKGVPAVEARIFRYVVRQDRGGSPNPYHGWCSLAVCKPQIRRAARVGDWIIGLRSRISDQVICAMRVDEVVALADYWRDPRFRAKRPGRGPYPPDNFYRAAADGALVRVDNSLHDAGHAAQDIGGRNAIVSRCFWYFGDQSPELPTDLIHLVHSGQGHSLSARRRPDDLPRLLTWLSHWPRGVLGSPIDARAYRKSKPAGKSAE
jgi:hypothetical protein